MQASKSSAEALHYVRQIALVRRDEVVAQHSGERRLSAPHDVWVAATAIIGLIAFPLLKPGWVFVK